MTEKFKDSLSFVVRHYRPGAFRADRIFAAPRPWWRRTAVAASVAAGVLVMSAIVYFTTQSPTIPGSAVHEAPSSEVAAPVAPSAQSVIRLEFDDMPLSSVVAEIENAYNVEISGLDEADRDQRLTLIYEGNAAELVSAINEILGTQLTVEQ